MAWAGPEPADLGRLVRHAAHFAGRGTGASRPGVATWSCGSTSTSASGTLFGIGFSDNVIFRKQDYIRAVAAAGKSLDATFEGMHVYLHTDEDFSHTEDAVKLRRGQTGWTFKVEGTGFTARLGVTIERVEG